jgi:hypothetical protein
MNEQFAVWWASAGCLPDSETPAFVGTFEECEQYSLTDPDEYKETVGEYNLYDFYISPYEQQEEN